MFLPTIPSSQCAVWYRPKHRHKEVNTVFPITEKVSRIYSAGKQKRMTFIGPFLRPFYGAKDPPIVNALIHRNRGVGVIRHEPAP